MRHDAAGVEHQLRAAAQRLALRRDDDGLFEILQAQVRPLEVLHALFKQRELPRLDGRGHLVEVRARAEIGPGVADHHGPEGFAALDLLGRGEHELRGGDRVGVGLCAQREERHAVAEIAERGVLVLQDHAPVVRKLQISRGALCLAGVESAVLFDLFLRPGGRRETLRLHQREHVRRAEQIAELEGPLEPVVAAAHGRVDVAEIKADLVLRHHREPQRLEHHAAEEGRLGPVAEKEAAQPLALVAHVRERGGLRAHERDVFVFLIIPDKALGPARALLLAVKARARLVAEIAARGDVVENGRAVAEGLFIVRDLGRGHVVDRVHADVQPHEVEQLEGALLGPEDQIARQRVGLGKAAAAVRRRVHDRGQRHGADAVGDKARRVLAADRRFAEAVAEQRLDPAQDRLARLLVGDQLDKVHIAHGVEEMDAEEAALPLLAEALRDRGDRDVRGVGADDRVLARVLEDEGGRALLDGEVLRHGLDDQIAAGEQLGVLLLIRAEHAGADALFVRALHLPALHERREGFRAARTAALLALAAYHQDHIQAGARPAGGDGGSHRAGADDRHFSDALVHRYSFPRVYLLIKPVNAVFSGRPGNLGRPA